jgi:hypothetical protein
MSWKTEETSIPNRDKGLSLFQSIRTDSGTLQTPYSMGARSSFPGGGGRPWHETDHTGQPSTEVTNEWSCTSPPSYALYGMYGDDIFLAFTGLYIPADRL